MGKYRKAREEAKQKAKEEAASKTYVSTAAPTADAQAALETAKKKGYKGGSGDFFAAFKEDPSKIMDVLKGAVGIGISISDTVQQHKLNKKNAQGGGNTDGGGGDGGGSDGGGGGGDSDKILGMSKPVFFGVVGGIVLIAGVGIYFAVRGSGGSGAPAPAAS